jgi:NADH:ubiquinone oxidoreductase subunit 3 (subunit A)
MTGTDALRMIRTIVWVIVIATVCSAVAMLAVSALAVLADPDPLTITDEWADGYRCGQESRRRSGTIAALCVIGIAVLVLVVVGVTK